MSFTNASNKCNSSFLGKPADLSVFSSTEIQSSGNEINENCDDNLELVSWITNGFLGFLIILGNALVCTVFLRSKRLCRVYMNRFLLSLALCDVAVAVLIVPGYGLFCTGCSYSLTHLCWLFEGGKDVCFLTSVFSLLAITYDRYLAVFQPLSYRCKMTKNKVYVIIITSWLLPIILASVRNLWQHNRSSNETETLNVTYSNILLFTFVFCPIITTSVVNIRIIIAIQNQRRIWIPRSEPARVRAAVSSSKVCLRSNKGTMSCALVVLVFIVCWMPRACYFISRLFYQDNSLTPLLSKLSVSFLLFQSSVNPLIYSFYRAEFRIAAKSLITCRQNIRSVQ